MPMPLSFPLAEALIQNWFKLTCTLAMLALLTGCAAANSAMGGNDKKTALAEAKWVFAKGSIMLDLSTDKRLNDYAGEAHTTILGVYQLSDAAPFQKLMSDVTSASKTLVTGKVGPEVIHFTRYVVEPGKHILLKIDRAQDAKYVGINIGYFEPDAAGSLRLFEIPLTVSNTGWISSTYSASPAILLLRIQLGTDSIVNAKQVDVDLNEKHHFDKPHFDGSGKEIPLNADQSLSDKLTNIQQLQD